MLLLLLLRLLRIFVGLIRAYRVYLKWCDVLNMVAFVGVSGLHSTCSVVCCRERERLSRFKGGTLSQLRCDWSTLAILSLICEHVLSTDS